MNVIEWKLKYKLDFLKWIWTLFVSVSKNEFLFYLQSHCFFVYWFQLHFVFSCLNILKQVKDLQELNLRKIYFYENFELHGLNQKFWIYYSFNFEGKFSFWSFFSNLIFWDFIASIDFSLFLTISDTLRIWVCCSILFWN